MFYRRLETTCPYQEAVLPAGVGGVKRYLQVGKRRYLLESVVANGQVVTKENYWLHAWGKDTLHLKKSHQELAPALPSRQGQLRQVSFHNDPSPVAIPDPSAPLVDTTWASLTQAFSPPAVLALRPAAARTGQTVYVINQRPQFRGDTLACYTLERSRTGDSCQVVLLERATPASRQWHANARVSCVWETDRSRRYVTATRFFEGWAGYSRWVRTYATAALTDFTESHFNTWPSGHALQSTRIIYRRQFRQLSARRSRDTYTLPSNARGKHGMARPTFTIISTTQ